MRLILATLMLALAACSPAYAEPAACTTEAQAIERIAAANDGTRPGKILRGDSARAFSKKIPELAILKDPSILVYVAGDTVWLFVLDGGCVVTRGAIPMAVVLALYPELLPGS